MYAAYQLMQEEVTRLLLPGRHDNLLKSEIAPYYLDCQSPCRHTHVRLPIDASTQKLLEAGWIDG